MKRIKIFAALLLTIAMIISLAACGSADTDAGAANEQTESTGAETSQNNGTANEEEVASEPDDSTASGSNTLVIYFSRTGEQYGVGVIDEGNTAIVAKMIVEATGADSFEILPADDYYPMTYDELTEVAKQEQEENARPAYAGDVPDLSQYDTIFIGAPVWWGDWPMICYTFFENEDLSGKTLYPFSTHAGSGLSGFDTKLASAVPGSNVGKGLAIAGTDCQNDQDSVRSTVNDWLSGLGY